MEHPDDEPVYLSKTRRKRAMEELQALGEALVALPADRLKKIDLPEDLREALELARDSGPAWRSRLQATLSRMPQVAAMLQGLGA